MRGLRAKLALKRNDVELCTKRSILNQVHVDEQVKESGASHVAKGLDEAQRELLKPKEKELQSM